MFALRFLNIDHIPTTITMAIADTITIAIQKLLRLK